MDFLKRKPKDLDASIMDEHDTLDATGSISENSQTQKRRRCSCREPLGVIAIMGAMYVLDLEMEPMICDGRRQ